MGVRSALRAVQREADKRTAEAEALEARGAGDEIEINAAAPLDIGDGLEAPLADLRSAVDGLRVKLQDRNGFVEGLRDKLRCASPVVPARETPEPCSEVNFQCSAA